MFKALLVCFLMVGVSVPAWAMQPPSIALVDESATPSCIAVQAAWIAGQVDGMGTGNKGPAIVLINNCPTNFVITNIQMGRADAFYVDIYHAKILQGFLFASNDAACKTATAKMEERPQESLSHSDLIRGNALSASEWREQVRRTGQKADILICKELPLPIGARLTLGTPYAQKYSISGHAEKPTSSTTETDLNISGKVINPRDAGSPDAAKFADTGDNEAKYNLASEYIFQKINYDIAVKWLLAAANDGYSPAQVFLEYCYSDTECGQAINPEESYFWGLTSGYKDTFFEKGRQEKAEKKLTPEQITNIKKRVEAWRKDHPAKN